jgi:hypothetical protein
MARIFELGRKPALALRHRKAFLVRQLGVSPDLLRASVVERFGKCGKPQCQCHHGGPKHGPYYFLTQCLATGRVNKFLLKTEVQRQMARAGVEQYRGLLEQLEELSRINAELLRREERLLPD